MHILMLTYNRAGIGGGYLRAWSLARSLARSGHQVSLFAGRAKAGFSPIRTIQDNVALFQSADIFPRRWRHGGLSPLDALGRLIQIRRKKYDIVYGFDHRPAVALPALLRLGGLFISDWADLWGPPGLATEVNGAFRRILGRWDGRFEKKLRLRADGVTAISRYLGLQARELGIPEERIQIIPVGANNEWIRPLPAMAMRKKYELPLDEPVAVYNGFVDHDAGLLAESLALLTKKEPRLVLAYTGRRLASIEQAMAGPGNVSQVHYLGILPYPSLAEVLACGDVMLMPMSRRSVNLARMPNRFGDYLAAGKPVVVTDVGDLAGIVRSEKIGRVSDADPLSFADSVLELLAEPAARREMGQRARHLAETRYSWDTLAGQLEDFFKKFL